MPTTLEVYDESVTGDRGEPILLEFLTDNITIRELIRERVYQQVRDYNVNMKQKPVYRGLVQPTDAERVLNGYQLKTQREIDWKKQFEMAVEGFEAGRILVLVNDRQAETLEEAVTITPDTSVSFLRLTPLVGG